MGDLLEYAAIDAAQYREGFIDGANRALNKMKLEIELFKELDGRTFDDLLEYIEYIRGGISEL